MVAQQAEIRVSNLDVHYGPLHVLKGVSATLPANKITAIIGPSGCGKTTLLKCINRLIDLTPEARVAGEITVSGEPVFGPHVDVTQVRQDIGLLSQRPYPLPMSIYDNVAFGPRIHGLHSGRTLDQTVQYYLEVVGLWEELQDRLDDPASKLSIGQQQRLCLARGLAVEPKVLLGDEPTSALDPISALRIEHCLQALKERYTVVMVTHVLRQARRIADYIVFVYLGEVIEQGPAQEIFEDPQEERTRAYIDGEFS